MNQPGAARRLRAQAAFAEVHTGSDPTDDQALDDILGLDRARVENTFTFMHLVMTHGHHRVEAGDMSYSIIRDMYHMLNVQPQTPLVDLGCGYGRIGFYGALLWNQSLHGIEIVPERVAEARRVQQEVGLHSLSFEVGDLLTVAWPNVSHYLLMNSDFPSVVPPALERLREIAQSRPITVASVSSSNEALRTQPWLQEHVPDCPSAKLPVCLRWFTSR